MKTIKLIYILSIVSILAVGCAKKNSPIDNSLAGRDVWLVNTNDIIHFGAEKDKIKSIDTPVFIPVHDVRLDDNALVYAFHHKGVTKVYPQSVMGMHEIVNDRIESYYYSISFCPRTESTLAWNRLINGTITEFGVSGMLYRENLIPYDRSTMSHWSQMKNLCINGTLIGFQPETGLIVETTLALVKNAYPDAIILDHESCSEGSCGAGSGREFGNPGTEDETTILPPEARYFGVLKEENLLLFELALFNDATHVIETRFRNMNLVIAGNSEEHFFLAFIKNQKINARAYYAVQNSLPVVMKDDLGNEYDMFGVIVKGPDTGVRLSSPAAFLAQTFAWQTLLNSITVYE